MFDIQAVWLPDATTLEDTCLQPLFILLCGDFTGFPTILMRFINYAR